VTTGSDRCRRSRTGGRSRNRGPQRAVPHLSVLSVRVKSLACCDVAASDPCGFDVCARTLIEAFEFRLCHGLDGAFALRALPLVAQPGRWIAVEREPVEELLIANPQPRNARAVDECDLAQTELGRDRDGTLEINLRVALLRRVAVVAHVGVLSRGGAAVCAPVASARSSNVEQRYWSRWTAAKRHGRPPRRAAVTRSSPPSELPTRSRVAAVGDGGGAGGSKGSKPSDRADPDGKATRPEVDVASLGGSRAIRSDDSPARGLG
jgi:hypothetical protein